MSGFSTKGSGCKVLKEVDVKEMNKPYTRKGSRGLACWGKGHFYIFKFIQAR